MSISARRITKRFDEFVALDDVSVEVERGSLTALLGPSGSGKSTLLRVIAGLERPDAGSVFIDGKNVTARRPQDRGVGFVFQHYAAAYGISLVLAVMAVIVLLSMLLIQRNGTRA